MKRAKELNSKENPSLQKETEVTELKISYDPTPKDISLFYDRMDNIANQRKLTIAQVRSQKGMEDISEEDAKEIIHALYQFSIISYRIAYYGTGKLK